MKTKNVMLDTLERKREIKREKKKRQKVTKQEKAVDAAREVTDLEQEAVEMFQEPKREREYKTGRLAVPFTMPTKQVKGMWKGIKTRSKQKNKKRDNRPEDIKRVKLGIPMGDL